MKGNELSGEALAEEILIRVMGWTRRYGLPYPDGAPVDERGKRVEGCLPFRPDLDIAQAWMVLEKMVARGWSMWVGPNPEKCGGGWAVQIKPLTHNSHEFVYAETAPLAICRAAILAVESALGAKQE